MDAWRLQDAGTEEGELGQGPGALQKPFPWMSSEAGWVTHAPGSGGQRSLAVVDIEVRAEQQTELFRVRQRLGGSGDGAVSIWGGGRLDMGEYHSRPQITVALCVDCSC